MIKSQITLKQLEAFAVPVLPHAKHTLASMALHEMTGARGPDANQIMHSSAQSACMPMVSEGLGVALLPDALVRSNVAKGRLRALPSDWLPNPLSFFARYRQRRAPLFVQSAAQLAVAAMGQSPRSETVHQEF